jgi:4-alpha-glucanotransferase
MTDSSIPTLFDRDCGILVHPSSLPGGFGIGDFGPASLSWLEQLAENGQSLWQILPLNPAGYGDSPYQSLSAFAANPVFLSPESFHEEGLIGDEELDALRLPNGPSIDYPLIYANKLELAARASRRFFQLSADHSLRSEFEAFLTSEAEWLEPFALFSALKSKFGGVAWTKWPASCRDRQAEALSDAQAELSADIRRTRFEQFFLFRQWARVRARARELGVRIIGDLPIFVAHDSADVWCRRDLFRLTADGSPSVVAGVPPDYFSSTGQLWGNPLYDWEAHRAEGFRWWRDRLRKVLDWVDIVRIDHFRGFEACWEIPGGAKTAMEGRWIGAPGWEIFESFVDDWGYPLPVIAEDLGVITPEVVALRDAFHLPGLRIEQFAFGTDAMKDTFVPEAYDGSCVAYTGTHDNDTVVGWFNSQPGINSTRDAETIEAERAAALAYFKTDGSRIHWDFIEKLYQSDAAAALMPVQDLLGLGSEGRMNTPGVASGSWRWRLSDESALHSALANLHTLTTATRRGLSSAATQALTMHVH